MGNKYTEEAWLSWSQINQLLAGRKLVFFGRGEWMEKSIPYLTKSAAYIVDNNRYEQGQKESGLPIYAPERLKEEDPEKLFIIVATSGFPDVDQQLRGYGFRPGVHFCVSPSLKNFKVVSRINGHSQLLYFTCSDRPAPDDPNRGGGLYSYDIASRQKTKLIQGLCHGIVQSGNRLFLVDDLVGVRVLNLALKTTETIELPPKSRPHGIAHCPKRNMLFINYSGRDAVGMFDVESGESKGEISLSGKFKRSGVAQHHLNDVCVYDDYLYLSMFSFSGNWKIGMYDGGIMQYDIDTGTCMGPVVSDLWMPHTPIVINGVLYYCDSMRGIVSDTTWRVMTQFNGFVRGITYDGEFFYIGQSTHRYIDRREGTTNNISLDTGIFLVDPVHKATKFFSIPELSDINSVLVVADL